MVGETMEGLFKDALLKILSYFHNPELMGSLLLVYVIVSPRFSIKNTQQ